MKKRIACCLSLLCLCAAPAAAESGDVDLLLFDTLSAPKTSDAPPMVLAPEEPDVKESPKQEPVKAEPVKRSAAKHATTKPVIRNPERKPEVIKPAPVAKPGLPAPPAEPVKPEPAATKPVPQPPRLQPGDAVRIDVKDEADLSGLFTIAPDGKISLPLLQPLQAGGLTLKDFKDSVSAAYKSGFLVDPKVSVSKEAKP